MKDPCPLHRVMREEFKTWIAVAVAVVVYMLFKYLGG